jgi:hypothetical protein
MSGQLVEKKPDKLHLNSSTTTYKLHTKATIPTLEDCYENETHMHTHTDIYH